MREHELKIQSQYFERLKSGEKTFEIRKNDRDFQVGDWIVFHVLTDPDSSPPVIDGNSYEITYILQNFNGLSQGYCIMSLKPVYNH